MAVNISTLVNKIDFTFGEKLLESKDRFDLAIKVADDQSPLKLAIVNNAEHQQFVDQGYKILPTPKHPNSKNFLITDFAKSFKKQNYLSLAIKYINLNIWFKAHLL